MSKKFKIGDIFVARHYQVDDAPRFGKVIGYDGGQSAIIEWETSGQYDQPRVIVKLEDQIQIANKQPNYAFGNCFLVTTSTLKTRKKKGKFPVGMLIQVIKDDNNNLDSDIGKLGIVSENLKNIYFKIYLQQEMRFIWREYEEIQRV